MIYPAEPAREEQGANNCFQKITSTGSTVLVRLDSHPVLSLHAAGRTRSPFEQSLSVSMEACRQGTFNPTFSRSIPLAVCALSRGQVGVEVLLEWEIHR